MPIIAFASHKGGCGKTTTLVAVATELRLRGYSVAVLDCDPNRHAATYVSAFNALVEPDSCITQVDGTDEITIYNRIADAKGHDFILIDLPGVASKLVLKAMARAHLIIIPTQASKMDATDAAKTLQLIIEAEETIGRSIATRFLPSRWNPLRETAVERHTLNAISALGVPRLDTPMIERVAFKEMTYNGKPPRLRLRDESNKSLANAAANISVVVDNILSTLDELAAQAATSAA